MKKLLIVYFFGPWISNAQTLQSGDILGTPGNTFTLQSAVLPQYLNASEIDADSLWDFSGASGMPDNQRFYEVLEAGTSPHASIFPNANLLVRYSKPGDTTDYTYTHYRLTDSFYQVGEVGNVLTVIDTEPSLGLLFPFSVGDSFSDTYRYESSAFGIMYSYSGKSDVKALRTGKLMIPGKVIEGAFLVREKKSQFRYDYFDSSFFIRYTWYKPGYNQPLAMLRYYKHEQGDSSISFQYAVNHLTSLDDATQKSVVKVYPTIFSNELHIDGAYRSIQLYDVTGKHLSTYHALESGNHIDTKHLPDGCYFIHVLDANGDQHIVKGFKTATSQ